MHEISLVRTIFRNLEAQFAPEELARMERIQLVIGPLANVDTVLLKNAYDAVVEQEEIRFAATELHVREIPVLISCPVCEATSEVFQYRFVCGNCGKPCANVVQGNELLIESVSLKD